MRTVNGAAWLTTERLALRRLTPDDHAWFTEIFSDPAVTLPLGGPFDQAKIDGMFAARVLEYYDAHPGMGIWMTFERATGAPVGCHLINNIQGESIIQIGYFLQPSAWGKGFATEMGAALTRYAFTELGLPRLSAITTLSNTASQHVLLKIGLHRHGERAFPHPAYAAAGPMAWFEREAGEWFDDYGGRT